MYIFSLNIAFMFVSQSSVFYLWNMDNWKRYRIEIYLSSSLGTAVHYEHDRVQHLTNKSPLYHFMRVWRITGKSPCFQELKSGFLSLTGEDLNGVLTMAEKDITTANRRLALHVSVVLANEIGAPKGQTLTDSEEVLLIPVVVYKRHHFNYHTVSRFRVLSKKW